MLLQHNLPKFKHKLPSAMYKREREREKQLLERQELDSSHQLSQKLLANSGNLPELDKKSVEYFVYHSKYLDAYKL